MQGSRCFRWRRQSRTIGIEFDREVKVPAKKLFLIQRLPELVVVGVSREILRRLVGQGGFQRELNDDTGRGSLRNLPGAVVEPHVLPTSGLRLSRRDP